MSHAHRPRARIAVLLLGATALVGASSACSSSGTSTTSTTPLAPAGSSSSTPGGTTGGTTGGTAGGANAPIGHVFVINLENKGFDKTWGDASPATYLNTTLKPKGELLTQYYGIGHNSLTNYIAEISGQAPNPATQGDCVKYEEFAQTATVAPQQAVGKGCIYPAAVQTLPNQLEAKGRTWKGYMEDLDNPVYGPPGTCRHPQIGEGDPTLLSKPGAMYATKHNPFFYFHSIIDTPSCAANVVGLDQLTKDLQATATTPHYAMITPNQCNDAHDAPCADGQPGGLVSADKWLSVWVPKILDSPAFGQDGLLVITFDEAEVLEADGSTACCEEQTGPNTDKPGLNGPGGGRVGALLLSKKVAAGSTNDTPYNHYGLLCSIEDLFGLEHLGYAGQPGLKCFGSDVYNAKP